MDALTGVDIQELNVPSDFNYQMSRNVSINIIGAYRLPLTIRTTDGDVLLKAVMNPEFGIQTKLNIPGTVQSVVLAYQGQEVNINISSGVMQYDFSGGEGGRK